MTRIILNKNISEVDKKIPNTCSLVTTIVLNTKINQVANKNLDDAKYITSQECNKLTTENVAARLKQANLVRKTDITNRLISFNRKINSNKTKYLELQRKVNSLTTKD